MDSNKPLSREERLAAMQRMLQATQPKVEPIQEQPVEVLDNPAQEQVMLEPIQETLPQNIIAGDEQAILGQVPATTPTLRQMPDFEKIRQGYGKELDDNAIKAAMEERNARQFGADALNFIGAIGGQSPKDTEALISSVRSRANQPIEDISLRRKGIEGDQQFQQSTLKFEDMMEDEKLKADPNSIISSAYRDAAKRVLPNLPENATAADLESVLPFLKSQVAASGKGLRFERIIGEDGSVQLVGINPLTGEIATNLGQAGFAMQTRVDPYTGELIKINPSSGIGSGKVSSPQAQVQEEAPKKVTFQDLNPKQRDFVRDRRDALKKDDIVSQGREAASAAQNAKQMLSFGKAKGADIQRAVQNMLAKGTGERGVMTENDVAPFGGKQAVTDRLNRYLSMNISGKLPEEDRKFLTAFAGALEKAANRKIDQGTQSYIQEVSGDLSMSPEEAKSLLYSESLKTIKPQSKQQGSDAYSPAEESGIKRVMDQNKVSREKAIQALRQAGKIK